MSAPIESGFAGHAAGLLVVLACFLAVKRGLSVFAVLYGAVALCAVAVWVQ